MMKKVIFRTMLIGLFVGMIFTGYAWATVDDRIVRFTASNTPNIDPAQGHDRASQIALVNLYDSLIFQDYLGNLKNGVAESWTVSDDGLKYTFKIRDGILFHNGDKLTADDVVFSMKRLLTIKRGFSYLFEGLVKDISNPSDDTVVITLSEPFGPFLSTLTRFYIVNKKQVLEHLQDGNFGEFKDYGTNWLINNDAGSGPYKVVEMAHNQHLRAVKFPEYWKGFSSGNPEGFELLAVSEPVSVRTMMMRRQLEFTDEYQPVETYKSLEKVKGIDIFAISNGKMLYLSLNNAKAPTDDVHFRKALSYAIDYEALLQIFPWRKQPKAPIALSLIGAVSDLPYYDYDLEKAKEELSLSKYADNPDQFPVEIAWVADVPDREKLALAFQTYFDKLGVNVEVVKVPWAKFVDQASRLEDTPHGTTISESSHYSEAGSLLRAIYHSESIGTYTNTSWVKYPDIDEAIDKALKETDLNERLKLYRKAQELIVEYQPHIPIFEEPEVHAYQSGYLTWEPAELQKQEKTIAPGLDLLYMLGVQFREE